MLLVDVYPEDYELAEHHAAIRNSKKRNVGVLDEKLSEDHKSLEIDYWGALAEICFADILGMEAVTYDQVAGDGGISDLLLNGKTVQIKWAFHPWRSGFRPVKGKDFKADIGVLICPVRKNIVWREEAKLRLAGWLSKDDWAARKELVDIKYGPQWVVERDNLRPMKELLQDVTLLDADNSL